jgi:hypothetical protein
MEPLILIVVPGVVGGIVLALFLSRTHVPARPGPAARLEPMSTSMINMARIRPVGIGGLGMVAMAVAVAIFVPRIRLSMAIALVLGTVMAAVLVARRRREGGMSHTEPGAHTLFEGSQK